MAAEGSGRDGPRVRVMGAAEMDLALDWAAREGWNPGLSDAASFRRVDPDGFLVAEDASGPIAVLALPRYDARFAFLGLYIVRPDRRGRGHGLALWRAGLRHAGTRTVGLDGVPAQQENYRRSGFALAHRTIRFAGVPQGRAGADATVSAWDGDLAGLAGFDAAHFGAARPGFLAGWLSTPGHGVRVVREGVRPRGYGVIRPCREGFKIGPLFAETVPVARTLLAALVAACDPGAPVMLDVPEPNAAALDLARDVGLRPVFETARMYRGPAPALPLHRVFGITSFELG